MGELAQTTIGNVTLADEAMHPVDDHPQFNESALLTVFDLESGEGGYLRIGNRPNEGHAEATLCWFEPSGSALFSFDRAPISNNARFVTERMTLDVERPGQQLVARFDGEVHRLSSPRRLVDPKSAFTESPQVRLDAELTFEGVSPLYGGTPFPGLEVGGHFEQHMRVHGRLTVDGRERRVKGWGNRDHSWGPRVWQSTHADRTLWCTFGEDFGIATSLTWKSHFPDVYEVIGYVWRGGVMTRIVDGAIHSEFEDPERRFHTTFSGHLLLEDGSILPLEGRALAMAPLRHRRGDLVTYIGWAMAEFVCDGRRGAGLSEYLDLGRSAA